jgi:CRISPR-associated protein Cmr5
MNTTLAQKRSAYALDQVIQLENQGIPKFDKLASSLPALILQNGFGQTLAFLLSKATKNSKLDHKTPHYQAFRIITQWHVNQGKLTKNDPPKASMTVISEMSQSEYLHMQEETLALLEWVKRYANADLLSKR